MPAYQNYTKRSANNACLAEARSASGQVVVELQDPNTTTGTTGTALDTIYKNNSACTGAAVGAATADAVAATTVPNTAVTLGSDATNTIIAFSPKAPGDKFIECNITRGGSCEVTTKGVQGR
ncbi:hypothetical protein [Rappaport israeli]|uniref:hypothetical protein n=1 Tax=Rappaport israeli TaxID=1839807 RepID=UPI0018E9A000|nr:hypothetical protein [Rappaport israeli]